MLPELLSFKLLVQFVQPSFGQMLKRAGTRQPLGFRIIIVSEALNQLLTACQKHNGKHKREYVDFFHGASHFISLITSPESMS